MQSLTQRVLNLIKRGDKVLDLGAGAGRQAEEFLKGGAKVTAIDKRLPKNLDKKIQWIKSTIEKYIKSLSHRDFFDVIFIQNVTQFIEKETVVIKLIPKFKEHLSAGGIFAVRTFYQNPEPPFKKSQLSLYNLDDLILLFKNWNILYSKQFSEYGPGLDGVSRRFYLTDLIVRKR